MKNNSIAKLLNDGLLAGYAGGSKVTRVTRAGFEGHVSHIENNDGDIYHDEWFVPHHIGGGQELVRSDDQMYTRLYGGGTPPEEVLKKLGITTQDVGSYLKGKIIELGKRTRLYEDCLCEPEGEWRYTYEIILTDPHIPVIVAAESITYRGIRVHLHPFILSPVK